MPITYQDFTVRDIADFGKLNPDWAEVYKSLPGSELSSVLYGGFLYPDWVATGIGDTDSGYHFNGWNTSGMNPASKFMAGVANGNAATVKNLLSQLYPNATPSQLDEAALKVMPSGGYNAWHNPIDTVKAISGQLGGLSNDQASWLDGMSGTYAGQLSADHKQYDSIQSSRDKGFYSDFAKSAALTFGPMMAANAMLGAGASGAGGTVAGAGEFGAEGFTGLGGAGGSGLSTTAALPSSQVGAMSNLGVGSSVEGMGLGSGISSSGGLGMHVVSDPLLGTVATPSLASMGGGTGVLGAVDGVGALTAGGVLAPAAGGAAAIPAGMSVGGIPTSLAFDSVNLVKNGLLNADGSVNTNPSSWSPRNVNDLAQLAGGLLGGAAGGGGDKPGPSVAYTGNNTFSMPQFQYQAPQFQPYHGGLIFGSM